MANTKSALRAIRKINVRTAVNTARRSRMKSFVRKVEAAITAGDKEAAAQAFHLAESEIRRAASKGVIHINTASRKVSRLSARVKALSV